jgi:hypothetical protein
MSISIKLLRKQIRSSLSTQFGMFSPANAHSTKTKPDVPAIEPATDASFVSLKQIDAGLINVGNAEAGPADRPPVILLHGWPTVRASWRSGIPLNQAD